MSNLQKIKILSPKTLNFLGQFTVCTANEDATPCPQDNRIIFEKFTSASRVKGTVFTETNACMATILYSKPGDNGTWIMFEQAYGFGAWVSLSKGPIKT